MRGIWRSAILGLALGAAATLPAAAQQCEAGPRCLGLQTAAEPLIGRVMAGGVTMEGVAAEDIGTFCLAAMTVEIGRACAVEQRELGNEACAGLMDQQISEAGAATVAIGARHSRLSATAWRQICGAD